MRALPIILAAALVASTACRSERQSAGPRIDPALATLIPPGTSILVAARLEELRKTAIYQRHFSSLRLPQVDEFARETGVDPRRDLWETLFCSNGRDQGVLMVRGKFATGDLEPRLERRGATRTRYKGYSLFGDDRAGVVFMNTSTALLGPPQALRAIIDRRDREPAGVPENLRPLIASLPADAQFWAVFEGTPALLPVPSESNLSNLNHLARSVQSAAVSGDLRTGLSLKAHGACATDQDAKQIHDTLKGLIGLARLSTPENRPELLKVYDSIEVRQQGRRIDLTADVPQDVVDRFVNTFLGRRS
jgi:hypothetical protein